MKTEMLTELGHLIEKGKAALALRRLDSLLGIAESTASGTAVGKKHSKTLQRNETDYLHALFLRADALRVLNKLDEAATAYVQAARQGTPRAAKAWHQAGIAFALSKQPEQAVLCMQRSVFLDPTRNATRYNLCTRLYEQNAASAIPGLAGPLLAEPLPQLDYMSLATALHGQGENDKALQALRNGERLNPNKAAYLTALLQGLNFACDWDGVAEVEAKLAHIPQQEHVESHLLQVARCMDERTNIETARRTTKVPNVTPYSHENHVWEKRLKIGYLSSDFFNHATMHLMGGVFNAHNKEEFEIFAYDHSFDDNSSYRNRFLQAVDHHIDISALSDKDAAQRIYNDGIDILVDLKGMTEKTRVMLLASHPAPVQMSYLGFPGSSGVDFLDYAIADAIVTPDSSKPWYSEKLCRLPETYQCNDMLRAVDAVELTRADEHLPPKAVVFCCFNQHYKFDRQMFATWCNVLKSVPNSVLWLLNPGDLGKANLHREAARNGIDPLRLVFAERVIQPRHLRRIALADIALDTRIYNGHTTTSDALWAGVPVVTVKGTHFASRVSASLLTACGLPELVANDMSQMVDIAVELGTNPQKLADLRCRVEKNRFIAPLFDTERFTRHFELAFKAAAQRAMNGLPPDHLDIPPLPPRTEPFMTAVRTRNLKPGMSLIPDLSLEKQGYRQAFGVCPLCGHTLGTAFRKSSLPGNTVLGKEEIDVFWVQCRQCKHICSTAYWTATGKQAVARTEYFPGEYSLRRMEAARLVSWVTTHLRHQKSLPAEPESLKWADFYPETAWLSAAATDCGFPLTILTETPQEQAILKKYYPGVHCGNIYRLNIKDKAHVVTLQGALESQPFPGLLLERARLAMHDAGLLLITFTSGLSMDWQQRSEKDSFMSLNSSERAHLFQRTGIQKLLEDNGLYVVDTMPLAYPDSGVALLVKSS